LSNTGICGSIARSSTSQPSVSAEPAEPSVGEIEVDFLAQPPLRSDAVAVANQQHPQEKLGINRRPADRTVEWRQFAPNDRKIDEPIDVPQHVSGWYVPLQRELVEQSRLISLLWTHHRFSLRRYRD
jgi:hypothetical protein